MSYDISCFLVPPGRDPMQVYEALCEQDERQQPPDPELEKRKRAIADALMRENPKLEPFAIRHDQIAAREGISLEEAKSRYRHIELNGPDDGNGIQITALDNEVSITVPYWHKGENAEAVFQEIWEYLKIIAGFGFACYDPQLGRVLHLETDMREALNSYEGGVAHTQALVAPEAKPWWKFW